MAHRINPLAQLTHWRRLAVVALCAAALAACERKEQGVPPAAADEPSGAQPPPETAALQKPTLIAAVPPEVTPALDTAAVRVEVTIASTIKRLFSGVILHREALDPPISPESIQRIVAVAMPDLDEQALTDPACVIKVHRTKPDSMGGKRFVALKAMLLHFDPRTHVAIVQCAETFPCKLDGGLRPASPSESAVLLNTSQPLRAVHEPAEVPARPKIAPAFPAGSPLPPAAHALPEMTPEMRRVQELAREDARAKAEQKWRDHVHAQAFARENPVSPALHASALRDGKLVLREADTQALQSAGSVVVTGPGGGVSGFGVRAGGEAAWHFHPLSLPQIAVRTPRYVPNELLSDHTVDGGMVRFHLHGSLEDPYRDVTTASVGITEVSTSDATPEVSVVDGMQIMRANMSIPTKYSTTSPISFFVMLPYDQPSSHHFVQVRFTDRDGATCVALPPFLLSLDRQGDTVVHRVRGLAASDAASTALANTSAKPAASTVVGAPAVSRPAFADDKKVVKELTTESPILYGVPIREGREVLLRLKGAPYWKRLSLEKRDWLPLPQADLATSLLAGNKDAIFLLGARSGEIKRYNADSLQPEASAMLVPGVTYRDLAAGPLSAHAPLAVITARGILACDPHTLAFWSYATPTGRDDLSVPEDVHFLASGDGRLLLGYPLGSPASIPEHAYCYMGPLRGFARHRHARFDVGTTPTVSTSFLWNEGLGYLTPPLAPQPRTAGVFHKPTPSPRPVLVKGTGAFSTSPILFRITRGEPASVPPVSEKCSLYSYFSAEPFVEFSVPEFASVQIAELENIASRAWLDAASMTVAFWHADRAVTMHALDLARLPAPNVPVLLNFPDAFAQRGGVFQFTPSVWGPDPSRATVTEAPAGVADGGTGAVRWSVPKDIPSLECKIAMKLTGGSADARQEFHFSLMFDGAQPAAAVAPDVERDAVIEALRSLPARQEHAGLVALSPRYYLAERKINEVLSGIDGYLLLKMSDGSLRLLSQEDLKVAGSVQLPVSSVVFPAGDSVLVYDTSTSALSRLAVPDFRQVARLPLPSGGRLLAVSVGELPHSPVGLLSRQDLDQYTADLPGVRLRVTRYANFFAVLDKSDLKGGKWAQLGDQWLALPDGAPVSDIARRLLIYLSNNPSPERLPASRDGRFVMLPNGHVIISPTLTAGHVHESGASTYSYMTDVPPACSSAGDRLYADGSLFRLGEAHGQKPSQSPRKSMSRCGNYLMDYEYVDRHYDILIESTDDLRTLARIVVPFAIRDESQDPGQMREVTALGEKNLIACLSPAGRVLQVVPFDLAAVLKRMSPATVIATSHPTPVVAQGRKFEYQVTVSNPDAVKAYRLRDSVPGASIDENGRFVYQAPAQLDRSQEFIAIVEIELKDGSVVTHEFPVYVIPVPAAAPQQQPPPQQPPNRTAA